MANDVDAGEGTGATPQGPGDPHPIFNWMSVFGGSFIAIGGAAMAFFFVRSLFDGDQSGYAGLLLLPPFLIAAVGVLLLVAGWVREVGRQRRGVHSSFFTRYTFDPWEMVRSTGIAVMLGGLALGTLLVLSAGAGSLAVMEYSESNAFCGETCHAVMSPEYTAYADGAHSRVQCTQCHVAPGAEGFLAAKIGGLRQLWGVTFGEVTRPIPTPIQGSISRERCRSCHSSDLNVGYRAVTHDYYLNGAEDEAIQLAMVVKVGGGSRGLLSGGGIHYHMQVAEKVEFIARDPQRQEIAWVRVTDQDGKVREYSSEEYPLSEEEKESLAVHQMECIDCHSRAAHAFRSPVVSVNEALRSGKFPSDVPNLKEASVRALDGDYASTAEAMEGIAAAIDAYYEEEDPDVLEDQAEDLDRAKVMLRSVYKRTIFPEMKADWRAHPDNIGHFESPGCFRCHNDEMLGQDDEPLFSDCYRCHAVLAQDDEAISTMADFEQGRGFVHPEDGSTFDEFTLCTECHDGGQQIYD